MAGHLTSFLAYFSVIFI